MWKTDSADSLSGHDAGYDSCNPQFAAVPAPLKTEMKEPASAGFRQNNVRKGQV